MSKRIEIVCSGGEVKIEAFGFTGAACEQATKFIEQGLGGKTKSRTPKPEMRQQAQQGQKAGH